MIGFQHLYVGGNVTKFMFGMSMLTLCLSWMHSLTFRHDYHHRHHPQKTQASELNNDHANKIQQQRYK